VGAQTCPSCGGELPAELGQHALVPSAGVVECPHCGAHVPLDREGDGADGDVVGESTGPETFSGHETVEGVMEELSEKEEG
jgi:hypothetical protein